MTPTIPALVGLGARAILGAVSRLARRRARPAPAPGSVSSPLAAPASVACPPSAPVPAVAPAPDPPPAPRGWAVLAEGEPLTVLARAVPLPCCAFVALWAREVAGLEPRPVPSAHKTYAAALAADRAWWADANIWDAARPWSSVHAVAAMLGGAVVGPVVVSTDGPAPELTAGRWHVVQHWYRGSGHTYLIYAEAESDGYDACTRVHSSVDRGYRVEPYTWGEGMGGYSVAVLTLPEGV